LPQVTLRGSPEDFQQVINRVNQFRTIFLDFHWWLDALLPHLQLIAPNFYDWGNGREMRTELFNPEDIGKALFEQTIKD
ncbi:unnamed protein product, partial [Rotaria sp. Silwood2]